MKPDEYVIPDDIRAALKQFQTYQVEDPESEPDEEYEGWPPDETLLGYREVLSLFKSEQAKRAVELLRNLVGKPIRLAPDSVVEDIHTLTGYHMGRYHPFTMLSYGIFKRCQGYASTLEKGGHPKDALHILALGAELMADMVDAEPVMTTGVVMATSMRQVAWKEIGAMLSQIGDTAGSEMASRYESEALDFKKVCLKPFLESYLRRTKRLYSWLRLWLFPSSVKNAHRKELENTRQIARQWTERLNNAECRAFLERLREGADI